MMPDKDVFFDGPQPPPGRNWCMVCAMLYKNAGIQRLQEHVDEARRSGGRVDLATGAGLGTVELGVAVTRSLSTVQPQWGPVDVCWSHAMGLTLMPSGLAPASPQDTAMLSQGRVLGNGR